MTSGNARRSRASETRTDREKALAALNRLHPTRAVGRDSWLKVGMALHSVSEDLLDAWDTWSRSSEKYEPGECARQWRSFQDKPNALTIGSLIHWANEDSPRLDSAPARPESAPATRTPAPTSGTASTSAGRSDRKVPPFSPSDASRAWNLAITRARLDPPDPRDAPAYAYLAKRGLAAAFDEGVYGILGDGMDLHPSIAWWPENGYRIVSPLFDAAGEIANIQARAIIPVEKKTRFPTGSRAAGTVFANAAAQQLLRYRTTTDPRVIVVEGLTDFLAMCVVTSIPVMGAPGAEMFQAAMGEWVRDRLILLAPDHDDAGNRIIDATSGAAYERGAREVRTFRWPPGCKDAADALGKVGPEDVFRAIESSIGSPVS